MEKCIACKEPYESSFNQRFDLCGDCSRTKKILTPEQQEKMKEWIDANKRDFRKDKV